MEPAQKEGGGMEPLLLVLSETSYAAETGHSGHSGRAEAEPEDTPTGKTLRIFYHL